MKVSTVKRYQYEIVLVETDNLEYLNKAGREGWRAVGFVESNGGYVALMERRLDEVTSDERS